MRRHVHVPGVDQYIGGEGVATAHDGRGGGARRGGEVALVGILSHRVDVELYAVAEEAAERLEDAALEVLVVLLVEDLEEVVDTHRHADHLLRVAAEIGAEPVVLGIIRDEHRETDVAEDIDAGKEVAGV